MRRCWRRCAVSPQAEAFTLSLTGFMLIGGVGNGRRSDLSALPAERACEDERGGAAGASSWSTRWPRRTMREQGDRVAAECAPRPVVTAAFTVSWDGRMIGRRPLGKAVDAVLYGSDADPASPSATPWRGGARVLVNTEGRVMRERRFSRGSGLLCIPRRGWHRCHGGRGRRWRRWVMCGFICGLAGNGG